MTGAANSTYLQHFFLRFCEEYEKLLAKKKKTGYDDISLAIDYYFVYFALYGTFEWMANEVFTELYYYVDLLASPMINFQLNPFHKKFSDQNKILDKYSKYDNCSTISDKWNFIFLKMDEFGKYEGNEYEAPCQKLEKMRHLLLHFRPSLWIMDGNGKYTPDLTKAKNVAPYFNLHKLHFMIKIFDKFEIETKDWLTAKYESASELPEFVKNSLLYSASNKFNFLKLNKFPIHESD